MRKSVIKCILLAVLILVAVSCVPDVKPNNSGASYGGISFTLGNNTKAVSAGDGARVAGYDNLTHEIRFQTNNPDSYCSLSGATDGFVDWPEGEVFFSYGDWSVSSRSLDEYNRVIFSCEEKLFTVGSQGVSTDEGKTWGSEIYLTESYSFDGPAVIQVADSVSVLDKNSDEMDPDSYYIRWYTTDKELSEITIPDRLKDLTGFEEWDGSSKAADNLTFALVLAFETASTAGAEDVIFSSSLVFLENLTPGYVYTIGQKDGEFLLFEHVHTMEAHEAKDPTCTDAGNKAYWFCSICERYYEDVEGTMEFQNGLQGTVLPATGHSLTEVPEKQATCTANGYISHWRCSVCGNNYKDSLGEEVLSEEEMLIKATGHDISDCPNLYDETNHYKVCKNCSEHLEIESHKFGDWNDDGTERTRSCSVCGYTEHSSHVHSLTKTERKEASCTENGNIEYWTCSLCNKYFLDDEGKTETTLPETVVPAHGHSFTAEVAGQVYLVKAATCTEQAAYYKSCVHCGEKGIETFKHGSPLGHDWVAGQVISPTATSQGYTVYTCSRCGETKNDNYTSILEYEVPVWTWNGFDSAVALFVCKNDSTYNVEVNASVAVQIKDATCSEEGQKTYTASVVFNGNTYTDTRTQTIAKLEHTVTGVWSSDAQNHWKTCSVCGEEIDKSAHSFGEWIHDGIHKTATCSVCGYSQVQDDDEVGEYEFNPEAESDRAITGIISTERVSADVFVLRLQNSNENADMSSAEYKWYVDYVRIEGSGDSVEIRVESGDYDNHTVVCVYSNTFGQGSAGTVICR